MTLILYLLAILIFIIYTYLVIICLFMWIFGRFVSRYAIIIIGATSILFMVFLIFFIPDYCNSIGDPPGQSYEGCGNLVGFVFNLFVVFVLPITIIANIVLTYFIYKAQSARA